MIFDKVKEILMDQLDVEEEKVTMEASIVDDLGADSLDLVDMVMSLEEEFDVEIPDDQVVSMASEINNPSNSIIPRIISRITLGDCVAGNSSTASITT